MKKLSFIAILALLSSACNQNTSIVWYEGETQENGTARHRIVVNNPPKGDYYVSFAMTPLAYQMGADSQGVIENVCGPLYKVVPCPDTKAADSLVVAYIQEHCTELTSGQVRRQLLQTFAKRVTRFSFQTLPIIIWI